MESRHFTDFQAAHYENIQVAYLDSILYILKYMYVMVVLLFFIILIVKAKITQTWNIIYLIGFILFPFVNLFIESKLLNLLSYIISNVAGNVYSPIPPPPSITI